SLAITGTATANITLNPLDGTYSGTYDDFGTVTATGTATNSSGSFPINEVAGFDTGAVAISGKLTGTYSQTLDILGSPVTITAHFINNDYQISTSGSGPVSIDGASGTASASATLNSDLKPVFSISGPDHVNEG